MVINNLIGNNDSDCWEKRMPFVCFIVSTTITSIFANLAMACGPKKYKKTTSKATCTRIISLVIRKAPCRHYASHFESQVQNDMFKGFTLPKLIDNNTRYVHTSLKSYQFDMYNSICFVRAPNSNTEQVINEVLSTCTNQTLISQSFPQHKTIESLNQQSFC